MSDYKSRHVWKLDLINEMFTTPLPAPFFFLWATKYSKAGYEFSLFPWRYAQFSVMILKTPASSRLSSGPLKCYNTNNQPKNYKHWQVIWIKLQFFLFLQLKSVSWLFTWEILWRRDRGLKWMPKPYCKLLKIIWISHFSFHIFRKLITIYVGRLFVSFLHKEQSH